MSRTIAIDLDGTLAHYEGWQGEAHIGDPVPAMVEIVLNHIANGDTCVIFTARVSGERDEANMARYHIRNWLRKHNLPLMDVTCIKEKRFSIFYDDRAIQIACNQGRVI